MITNGLEKELGLARLSNLLEDSAPKKEKPSFVQKRRNVFISQKLKPNIQKRQRNIVLLNKKLLLLLGDSRVKAGPRFGQKRLALIKRRKLKVNIQRKQTQFVPMDPQANTLMRPKKYGIRRQKRSPHRLMSNAVNDKREVVNMQKTPSLLSHDGNSVVKRVTQLITTFLKKTNDSFTNHGRSKWMDSYKHLLEIKKAIDQQAEKPGARVYDLRMYDLVIGNNKQTEARDGKLSMPPLIKESYSIVQMLEGKSKMVRDSSNIKFLR
ncbi:hypothetical protein KIN20_027910 [Parelaphostrongylus tenuis]|uniref:Uncharacterized protein n=1 Tax=Parelaphostrongylus tenuis TaxID=148309 RepID=A0AAD5R052_PARTN|nr:hypothetical protein KIN20_027910 [Parelaphostrongylus tenuis]